MSMLPKSGLSQKTHPDFFLNPVKQSRTGLPKIQEIKQGFAATVPAFGNVYTPVILAWIQRTTLLNNGLCQLLPNVQDKINLPIFTGNPIIQASTCTSVAPVGTTASLVNKVLQTCQLELLDSLCYKDFQMLYTEDGAWRQSPYMINPMLANAYLEQASGNIELQIEDILLQGDTAAIPPPGKPWLALCDGLIKKLTADPGVPQVAGGGAFTAANVIAQMQIFYNLISNKVIFGSRNHLLDQIYIACSYETHRFLQEAYQAATGFFQGMQSINFAQVQGLLRVNANPDDMIYNFRFNGIPIIPMFGMPDDTLYCAPSTNLFVGTDAMGGGLTPFGIEFIPNYMYNNERKDVGVRSNFNLGIEYGLSDIMALRLP